MPHACPGALSLSAGMCRALSKLSMIEALLPLRDTILRNSVPLCLPSLVLELRL